MARIEHSIEIAASPAVVWGVVSELSGVTRWNPNIAKATCSAAPFGVGTARTCELSPVGSIDEIVSVWEEGRRVEFSMGPHGGIRSADSGFELHDLDGATRIAAYADYHLAFGPLGPVIDRLTVRRQMQRMLVASLEGLKGHIEADSTIPQHDDEAPATRSVTNEGDPL